MGQNNVAVLAGAVAKWQPEGGRIEDMPPVIRDRHMTVRRRNHMLRDVTQVASASKLGDHSILDARAAARFRGDAPEPRAGLRSGHIPGSRSLPYTDLLTDAGTMKEPDTLRAAFDAAGADLSKPVITTCGSGISAAVINLALERIGKTDHALYDGSWAEWGAFPTVPVATGDA